MKTLRKIITVCCLLAFMFIVNPVSAQENPTIEQMKDQLVQKGFTEEYLNVIEDELIEALYTDHLQSLEEYKRFISSQMQKIKPMTPDFRLWGISIQML